MAAIDTTPKTVATFVMNGKERHLRIMQNADGTWTAGDPWDMRDFARRANAIRWLRRIWANPGVEVAWTE